jgi:hypothetical protein
MIKRAKKLLLIQILQLLILLQIGLVPFMLEKEEENKKFNQSKEVSRNSKEVNGSEKFKRSEHETVIVEPMVALPLQTTTTCNIASIFICDIIWMVTTALILIDTIIHIFLDSGTLDSVASTLGAFFGFVVAFELTGGLMDYPNTEQKSYQKITAGLV